MGLEPTVVFRQRIKSPRPSPLGSPVHNGGPIGDRTRFSGLRDRDSNQINYGAVKVLTTLDMTIITGLGQYVNGRFVNFL